MELYVGQNGWQSEGQLFGEVCTNVSARAIRPKFSNAHKGISRGACSFFHVWHSFQRFPVVMNDWSLRPVTGSKRKLHGELMLPLPT